MPHVVEQMRKLEECVEVVHIKEDEAFCRELALIKIEGGVDVQESIRELCDVYQADVVNAGEHSIIVRISGVPSKLDTFLSIMQNFNVVESSRTGITAVHWDKDKD